MSRDREQGQRRPSQGVPPKRVRGRVTAMRIVFGVMACTLCFFSPALTWAACSDGDAQIEAGDFIGAITAYQQAMSRPECKGDVAALRINEAYARERLAQQSGRADDACEALYAWRRALPGASARVAAAAESSIEAMRVACVLPARLLIECEPAGATVRIAALGEPRPCPATFDKVSPGRYAGVALAAGVETPFVIEAVAGETRRITVALRSAVIAPDPPDRPLPGADPMQPDAILIPGDTIEAIATTTLSEPLDLTPYAWTSAGVTLIGAGLMAFGAIRLNEIEDDARQVNADSRRLNAGTEEERRAQSPQIEARQRALESDHASMRTLTTLAGIGMAVFATTAVVLFVLDEDPAPPAAGQVRMGPGLLTVAF